MSKRFLLCALVLFTFQQARPEAKPALPLEEAIAACKAGVDAQRKAFKDGNKIALKIETEKLRKKLNGYIGRSVTWKLAVVEVTDTHVLVITPRLPDERTGEVVLKVVNERLDGKKGQPEVIGAATALLEVGKDIPLAEAAKLKRGDKVGVAGTVKATELGKFYSTPKLSIRLK